MLSEGSCQKVHVLIKKNECNKHKHWIKDNKRFIHLVVCKKFVIFFLRVKNFIKDPDCIWISTISIVYFTENIVLIG